MSSKAKTIAIWVVSALLAMEFAFASFPKLTRAAQAVEGFHKAGFSDGFLTFIGAAEALGAMGLLVPRLRFFAALGLSIIMIGAVYTHVTAHDTVGHILPAAISLLLLLGVAWFSRPIKQLP